MLLEAWCLLLLIAGSDGSCLIFPDGSPGYAQLEDVGVSGVLTVSLSFQTGSMGGQLLFLRELSAGHNISLSLAGGALHLQVHPDTLLIPLSEETGQNILYNDNKWHSLLLTLNSFPKFIILKIDDIIKTEFVQNLPLIASTHYQTFIGGLPPRLSQRSSPASGGCSLDYVGFVRGEGITGKTSVFSGAAVAENCTKETQPSLEFTGSMAGVVNQYDPAGSVIINITAENGDKRNQAPVLYELLENPHNYFRLEPSSGQLSIAKPLDRETLAGLEPPNNLLFLTVRVSQPSSEETSPVIGVLTIIIKDQTGSSNKAGGQPDCACGQKPNFIKVELSFRKSFL